MDKVSPKCHCKCTERKAEEDVRQAEEEKALTIDSERKECPQPPKLEEARNRRSPKASGGSIALRIP